MSYLLVTLTILIVLPSSPTDTAKVLVIPNPVKSVFGIGLQAGKAILDSGHEVWIMGRARYKEDAVRKGLHYLEYDNSYVDTFEQKAAQRTAASIANPDSHSKPSKQQLIDLIRDMNSRMCNDTLSNKVLMNTIRDHNFDLFLMGTTHVLGCLYLIPYKYNIPYVTYEPLDEPWTAGVTSLPSHQPSLVADPPFSNKMTFTERLINTALYIIFPLVLNNMNSGEYALWFVPEKPYKTAQQLRSLSKMFFIVMDNTCIDYPRQSAPNYRYIGVLTQAADSPLTGELKEFVDGAKEGLILITFGSTKIGGAALRHLLPKLVDIAPTLHQRVLLQSALNDDPGQFPSNIKFERWIPQNAILGHPNTVAMVSHGGANGQMEATYHGVPQVCIGIQEEQKYNCRRMEEHHYGLFLSLFEFSADDLLHALTEVISDPSYKQNVSRCSRIMRSLPQGKEQLAFWVDHILEFGGDHLRPSSADMPFYALYMLDILVVVILTLGLVIGIFIACVKCVCNCAKNVTAKVKTDWVLTSDFILVLSNYTVKVYEKKFSRVLQKVVNYLKCYQFRQNV